MFVNRTTAALGCAEGQCPVYMLDPDMECEEPLPAPDPFGMRGVEASRKRLRFR